MEIRKEICEYYKNIPIYKVSEYIPVSFCSCEKHEYYVIEFFERYIGTQQIEFTDIEIAKKVIDEAYKDVPNKE